MIHSLSPARNRRLCSMLVLMASALSTALPGSHTVSSEIVWEPLGLSGGGGMFSPAISPLNPDLMMINCDMSAAYISQDGGHHWRMINQRQLRSDTGCRPAFHPRDPQVIFASSGGQLRVSHDGGQTFSPIGNLESSPLGEIAIDPSHPDHMLVGTHDGHCCLSLDAGKTWNACAGPQGKLLAFHFDQTSAGKTLFAATDQGIWRSDDSGRSWSERTQGLPWKELQGFAGGSNAGSGVIRLYCSVCSKEAQGRFAGGVFVSEDRGDSWQSAMGQGINTETTQADQWAYGPIAQYQQLLTTDANPLLVYTMNTSTGFHPPHHETVYRSDDGGKTWRDVYFMDPRFERYNIAPNYVSASVGQSLKGGNAPFGVAICNADPERILLTRSDCHITHNGGKTWFHGDTYPAPGQTPKPGSAWVCNGLVVTTTWHYYVDPHEANRHYIAYTDLGFARSLDAGQTWIWWDKNSWAPWRNTCYEIVFDPAVPGQMWGAFSDVHDIPNDNIISERHGHNGPGGVCTSRDFGASWQVDAQGLPERPVTSLVLDPQSPAGNRTLYAGVFMEGVYKSTDDGKTWTLKKNGLGDPKNMRVYRVVLHKDGTLLASICAMRPAARQPLSPAGVGLYRSRDKGESWEQINQNQPLLYPKDFSVHPDNSDDILIGACDVNWEDRQGGLYRTQDGGRSWQRIGRQGPQTFGGYFHPDHDGWIYMTLTEGAPDAGLWLSRDDGRSWKPFDELPFSNIQRVEFEPADPQRIYVTTFGGSVWRGPATPGDEVLVRNLADFERQYATYDLDKDEANFARAERTFQHAGVAAHPGDKGMQAIADGIWKAVEKQASSSNWPEFRGPTGDGHASVHGLPLRWSETENITWKIPIHGHGWSSPVIWQNQIWVTTATEDGTQLFAVCVDRDTGKIVHDVKVFDIEKPGHVSPVNSYASPTPAIDGQRVYVHYGTYGTACLDTATGQVLWTRRDLNCDHHEGPGSSPILYEDLMIVHVDGRDVQYVIALDKATGETVWKANRSLDYSQFPDHSRKAFCTPTVIDTHSRKELLSPGAKAVMGYDPKTGQELWKIRHDGWSLVLRPIFGHGLVYFVNDFERPELWAIRPGGDGDVTDTHVVWRIREAVPAQPSMLLVGDGLYMVTDSGIASCIDAQSGDVIWKHRMGGNYAASPIFADGRIYCFSQDGTTTVLEPGPEYKVLAENSLEGELKATPAVAGRALFVRTRTHLYRIE